ncbi:MAG: Uma2 family endonuclease [Cyanobacteria bacterium P01_A01_bin.114]
MAQAADLQQTLLENGEDIRPPAGELWSDEPPLESDLHREQIDLLIQLLKGWWRDQANVYVSGNLTIYYDAQQITTRNFRGPDFFVVKDTDKKSRKSWVVWQEGGKYPNFILEILSDSTAQVDRVIKKKLYQDTFRTPEYFWFDPTKLELQGFSLIRGLYQPIESIDNRFWSEELGLYIGLHNDKLRFFTPESELIPSAEERAAHAEQQLAKLKAQLRARGIEPDIDA